MSAVNLSVQFLLVYSFLHLFMYVRLYVRIYSSNHVFISPLTFIYLFLFFREAALNDLEAYIYKVKNRISEDEEDLKEVREWNRKYKKP